MILEDIFAPYVFTCRPPVDWYFYQSKRLYIKRCLSYGVHNLGYAMPMAQVSSHRNVVLVKQADQLNNTS